VKTAKPNTTSSDRQTSSLTDLPPQALRFLLHLETERRVSRHTLSAYRQDLLELTKAAGKTPPEALTQVAVRRALAALHAGGRAPKSIARTLSAWRQFYAHLVLTGDIANNPCEGLKAPKAARTLPNALSPDAAGALVTAKASDDPWQNTRDAAIFELIYSSGLRVSEAAGVDFADLNIASAELRVRGKGSKTRVVPVGNHALAAIGAWMGVRAERPVKDSQALFLGARGERISVRTIQSRIKLLARSAGVDARAHPHMLRHSFASHMLQSSGDLRAVQELLGHASIASTQVYTHLDFQHLAKVYDAAHPRAKRRAS
jgi:integrase/recombinase XerC